MGINSLSYHFSRLPVLAGLLAPLQPLVALFLPASPSSGRTLAPSALKTPGGVTNPSRANYRNESLYQTSSHDTVQCKATAKNARSHQPPQLAISRLKIVREYEPGIGRTCAGRMMISGRMADVCAELDRMEQRESAACRHK